MIPIFRREMVASARGASQHSERFWFTTFLLATMSGVLIATYVLPVGQFGTASILDSVRQAFMWSLVVHGALVGLIIARGAVSIAKEKDGRTLDFLLCTRLSSSDIVLGKLTACMVQTLSMYAAGLPLMLVLYQLGCTDANVMLFAYAGIISTSLFLASFCIWISVEATGKRKAISLAGLLTIAWLVGPTMLILLMRTAAVRLPAWAVSVNGWLASSSPIGLIYWVAANRPSSSGLSASVEWMLGLQIIGSMLLTLIAVLRLRPAYRDYQSSDVTRRTGLTWRLRPRPAVGDDPIFWRARYTTRSSGVMKALEIALNLSLAILLVCVTTYYARAALTEVGKQGYHTKLGPGVRPEMNVFVSVFGTGGLSIPADFARTQFNVFLRFATILLAFVLSTGSGVNVAAEITSERARETWLSLLATPLSGHEILRSKVLAVIWRMRGLVVGLVALWTVGLVAGALHPIGYLAAPIIIAAWTWFFVATGAATALWAKGVASGDNRGLGFVMALPASALLPFVLPAAWTSVLLGAGSSLLVVWLSLVSYSDLSGVALVSAPLQSYPHLGWIGINSGEGPALVLLTCLFGTIGPAIAGSVAWRFAVKHFDRLAGRPFRLERAPCVLPSVGETNTM